MSYPVMSTSVPWSLVKSGFHKGPSFSSVVQETAGSMGNAGYSLKPYPTWLFTVDLPHIKGGEAVQGSVLQKFLGCYMKTCGRAGLFLFTDPNDSAVTTAQGIMLNVTAGAANPMGQAGDGTSTVFQLARSIDVGVDVLQIVTLAQVCINGTPTAAYSVDAKGKVTFSAAPAVNATITWAGTFQYLCRFKDDALKDLARVSRNSGGFLWACDSITFESEFI